MSRFFLLLVFFVNRLPRPEASDNSIRVILNFFENSRRLVVHTLSCEYLREFSKKIKTVLMGYSSIGGKLIHEKKPEVEDLVTLSLN